MRFYLLAWLSFFLNVLASGQENWDSYIAAYENGPGSTTLNMDLIDAAPKKSLPFLVISEFKFKDCDEHGFPQQHEFKRIYSISDAVGGIITSVTETELVGTFIYQCTRMNYFYVKDTLNIRQKIDEYFRKKYPSTQYATRIEEDRKWEAYVDFLYPGAEILEYMKNEQVLTKLEEAGDKLEKARTVDHWLYFPDKEKRSLFIAFAEGLKFKVESADEIKDSELPFQLHISRIDKVDRESINELTLALRTKATELGGEYDGWETQVIKD